MRVPVHKPVMVNPYILQRMEALLTLIKASCDSIAYSDNRTAL